MRYLILSILVLCSSAIFADNIKRPDSYNYSRGVEAINNNNAEEALDYLNKEIDEHLTCVGVMSVPFSFTSFAASVNVTPPKSELRHIR